MEYSNIPVIKEEIPSPEADVLGHTAKYWETFFERAVENNTNGYHGLPDSTNRNESAAQELDATPWVYLSSHSATFGDDITIECSGIPVIKEEILSVEADVLGHNAKYWETFFERTAENDTNSCDGLPGVALISASQNSSSSSEYEEETDCDTEASKTDGVTQLKKIVIADRAPLQKTASGLTVYDGDFIVKLRNAKMRLRRSAVAFKELENDNGEVVIGMNFQRKSLEKLFYLRNACKRESRRNSQRSGDTVRAYNKYSKILSALDEKIENLRGKGGETNTCAAASRSEELGRNRGDCDSRESRPSEPEKWRVRSEQRNFLDDLIKLSSRELHEVTGKRSKCCDLKDSSGELNKINESKLSRKRIQKRRDKNAGANSYERADLERKSHCSTKVSSRSLKKNVKRSTSKTSWNHQNLKLNSTIFSSRRSGLKQMQLGKRVNARLRNLGKIEEKEVVPSLKECEIILHRVDIGKYRYSSSLREPIGSAPSSQKQKTHSQGPKCNAGSEGSTRQSEELLHYPGNIISSGDISTLHSEKSTTTNSSLRDVGLQRANDENSANDENFQDTNSKSSFDNSCPTQRSRTMLPVPHNDITSDLPKTYRDSEGHGRSEVEGYQTESVQTAPSPVNNITNSSDTPSKAAKMANCYGLHPMSLIKVINGCEAPKESPRERKSKVDPIDYDPDFRARKKQKRQVKYDTQPHLDLENYQLRNVRFRDVEGSGSLRQDGDELQLCKNLNLAMLRNRALDGSESDSYFTVGGKNRPGVLMPSRGGGCARLRTYIKVMERGYYC